MVQQCPFPSPSHAVARRYGAPRSVLGNFLCNSVLAALCCALVAAVFAALSCLFAMAMASSICGSAIVRMHARSAFGALTFRGGDKGVER